MKTEKRIGVYICYCGSNIASMVDVEKLAEEVGKMPNVAISKTYKYMCSDPGQDMIIQDIKTNELDCVVVAACSPRIHELTFRKTLEKAGLNPYLFEMANIREHVSWVHTNREEATQKAKAHIVAAVHRVFYHVPLDTRFVDINDASLVIGGGIAGISAAIEIANAGRQVYLIEQSDRLGGQVANIDLTFPYMYSAQQMLDPKIKLATNHHHISLFLESEIKDISGYIGNFKAVVKQMDGSEIELSFGNIIVATGLKTFDPKVIKDYGYGEIPDVITSNEFEKMLLSGKIQTQAGKNPKNIAIVHCVGSRDEDNHPYCSRTCCMTALKYANQIRAALPETNIYDVYSDIRAFGKGCEEMYTSTSKRNVMFLKFDKFDRPKIRKVEEENGISAILEMNESLLSEPIDVPVDLVILMVAVESQEDAKDIAHKVGVSMCGNDFYIEKHPKLDPVATTTDGVYIVGNCQGPKDIPDSVAQAKAASARVLSSISRGSVQVEVTTAEVTAEVCCGCQTCIKVCPYDAIGFDEKEKVSSVNEILCKGCGTCGASCPSGAIQCKHFTDEQILAQIDGLLSIKYE